jgi:hypothetical protein
VFPLGYLSGLYRLCSYLIGFIFTSREAFLCFLCLLRFLLVSDSNGLSKSHRSFLEQFEEIVNGEHQGHEIDYKVTGSTSFASEISDTHTQHTKSPGKRDWGYDIDDLKGYQIFVIMLKFLPQKVIFRKNCAYFLHSYNDSNVSSHKEEKDRIICCHIRRNSKRFSFSLRNFFISQRYYIYIDSKQSQYILINAFIKMG